jgi:hypothetical protein
MNTPSSLESLIEALRCLPGVGPKSAQRMAYHLLRPSCKVQHAALRACQGSRCAGGSRYQQAGSRPDDDRRVARQAGLDHQSHQGNARLLAKIGDSWPIRSPTRTCSRSTRRTRRARSSRRSSSPSASAPTSAARRPTSSRPVPSQASIANWPGGFLCPCHGSTFDLAGRVYKSKPAPDNLEVPPHMYLGDAKLLIGEDKKA